MEILRSILIGGFYGGQAAVYGYLASEELPVSWRAIFTKAFWEKFSWSKAGKTVALGIVFGMITQGYAFIKPEDWNYFTEYTGFPKIPLPVILNFANTAVLMGVDKFSKFVVRRTPLVRLWDGLKGRVLKLLTKQEQLKKYLEDKVKEVETTP